VRTGRTGGPSLTARPDGPFVRCPRDLLWLAVGIAVLVLSALPVSPGRAPAAERDAFRAVNDLPTVPLPPVWLVMQLGNVVAVPLATIVALLARRVRLAVAVALSGAATYWLAKVVKHFVVRGRPVTVLADVVIRGAPSHGLGYVSGHAGVVTVLAFVAIPFLGPRWRWAVAVAAVVVCLTRVYVGAHLPLDMVGGAAVGLAVGAVTRLVPGRPAPCS
jgi:undecaprenyl-diphosphatase